MCASGSIHSTSIITKSCTSGGHSCLQLALMVCFLYKEGIGVLKPFATCTVLFCQTIYAPYMYAASHLTGTVDIHAMMQDLAILTV